MNQYPNSTYFEKLLHIDNFLRNLKSMTGIATIGKNINIKSDGAMKKKISKKIMCISRIIFSFGK